MTKHTMARAFHGVTSARADASDANAILAKLTKAFEDFKAENDTRLKAKADVVIDEKVDRINAAVSSLQAELDAANTRIAAMNLNGSGKGAPNPHAAAHKAAFETWFRRGQDAGLGDLEVKAALSTQSKPDGGFVVPTEMETTIDRILGTVSALRGLSTVRPIGTGTYTKNVNMGGSNSGWVGEEEARTETATPTLRELEFNVMEIYAEPYATQTVLDDAMINLEAWLADEVSIDFAEKEGAAFITGNGVKRPRGVLTYPTVVNSLYTWGNIGFVNTGAAAAFAATNPGDAFVDTYYALKAGYRANATWLTSDPVMGAIRKFKDGQGNYLWAPPTGPGELPTILGKPVVTDDNMPALGANAFPVAFGDFRRGYLVLDRQGIRVLRNPYKVNGKVAFYTTKRVGGGVQNFEAIKLLRCST
jgi:HK97 family phage major capsid protein